jgi:hypothetical protein
MAASTADEAALWSDLELYLGGAVAADVMVAAPAAGSAGAAGSGGAAGGAGGHAMTGVALLRRHSFAALFAALERAAQGGRADHVALACRALDRLLASPTVLQAAAGDAPSVPAGGTGDASADRDGASAAVAVPSQATLLLSYVQTGLAAGAQPVRALATRFLLRVAAGATASVPGTLQRQHLYGAGLLTALVARLTDPSPAVADAAADTLVTLGAGTTAAGRTSQPPQHALQPEQQQAAVAAAHGTAAPSQAQADAVAACLSALAASPAYADATVQTRLLATVARLAGASDEAHAAMTSHGLLERLLRAASDTSDVLLQLNVVQLLPPLAHSRRGLAALTADGGVFAQLLQWAGVGGGDGDDDVEPDALLGADALNAAADIYAAAARLGAAAQLRPQLVPGLVRVAEARCSAGAASEETMRAVDALVTAMTADARVVDAVLAARGLTREWLESGVSTTPELRLAVFSGLARVMHGAAPAVAAAAAGDEGVAAAAAAAGGDANANAAFARYQQLFERMGEHCGKDPVEVCLRCLRLVSGARRAMRARHCFRETWLTMSLGPDFTPMYPHPVSCCLAARYRRSLWSRHATQPTTCSPPWCRCRASGACAACSASRAQPPTSWTGGHLSSHWHTAVIVQQVRTCS